MRWDSNYFLSNKNIIFVMNSYIDIIGIHRTEVMNCNVNGRVCALHRCFRMDCDVCVENSKVGCDIEFPDFTCVFVDGVVLGVDIPVVRTAGEVCNNCLG